MQQDPNELLVVAFNGETRAFDVLKNLQQLNHEHLIHLKNAAVVVHERNGKLSIHETQDFDAKQGAIAGALAGGLLGMLKGEALEGAALGVAGGLIASKVIDLGFKDDYLREIGNNLTPGSSAIVALVQFEHVDEAVRALNLHGGVIMRQTLPADVAAKVSGALQG